MLRYKRWVAIAKRRPIATVAVLSLVLFLSVYFIQSGENYERIGINLLAEKKIILQEAVAIEKEPPTPLSERQIFEMDQSDRRKTIRYVCQNKGDANGLISNLIAATNFNLSYCVIPRSDNTFWLQVFRYLNRDYSIIGNQPRSPFELDIDGVHSRPFAKTRVHTWRLLTEEQRQIILKSKIFLSVQDPYMRLWSTYLRALILPEMWGSVGAHIGAKRPKALARWTPTCGHDVTFAEFITYVLESYEKDFAPYVNLCDPCKLNPHYVVKAETAHRDNAYLLEHLSLAWSVKEDTFQEAAVARMVNSTITASFNILHAANKRGCDVSQATLEHRLWKTFMMEGILPETPPTPPLDDIDQWQFLKLVLDNHHDAIGMGHDLTSHKRKYMVGAFKNLDIGLLAAIAERYAMDFKLFSYDSHPHDIFGGV